MKAQTEQWVVRTMLFVPAHLASMVSKAAVSDADCVVLDLQDAVPEDRKTEARNGAHRALSAGLFEQKMVMVRVNPLESGLTELDLDGVACPQLDGFVYPMGTTPEQIETFDAMLAVSEVALGLPGLRFSIVVLVETPLGVINAYKMAVASDRVIGLLFGAEDYLTEMHAGRGADEMVLLTPRAQVAMAARAAGVEAIDTPHLELSDPDGLKRHAQNGRAMGMSGMLVISPRQIPVVHAVYSPSREEIRDAEEILRAVEEAREGGLSYAVQDGLLVSPSKEESARRTLLRAAAIVELERRNSGRGGRPE
jgi:citrate lyase subunit beta/citryl-CoA lyase